MLRDYIHEFYGKPCSGNCSSYHTRKCPIYRLSFFTEDSYDHLPFGCVGCSYFIPVGLSLRRRNFVVRDFTDKKGNYLLTF